MSDHGVQEFLKDVLEAVKALDIAFTKRGYKHVSEVRVDPAAFDLIRIIARGAGNVHLGAVRITPSDDPEPDRPIA